MKSVYTTQGVPVQLTRKWWKAATWVISQYPISNKIDLSSDPGSIRPGLKRTREKKKPSYLPSPTKALDDVRQSKCYFSCPLRQQTTSDSIEDDDDDDDIALERWRARVIRTPPLFPPPPPLQPCRHRLCPAGRLDTVSPHKVCVCWCASVCVYANETFKILTNTFYESHILYPLPGGGFDAKGHHHQLCHPSCFSAENTHT